LYGKVSVWYGSIIRGDKNIVRVGTWSTIKDRAILSTVSSLSSGFPAVLEVGRQVEVGAGAILTSCTIKDGTVIGAGAIVGEGSVVGENCHIAAGAVLAPNTLVPNNQLWAGNPAVYVRDVSGFEADERTPIMEETWALAQRHSEEFLPYGTVYQGADEK
jgi:gamma-carbonic anhydrase